MKEKEAICHHELKDRHKMKGTTIEKEWLTKMDNSVPKTKQMMKPFILVPHANVDACKKCHHQRHPHQTFLLIN